MKISIIIPTYNEEEDIEKCLQSLSEQTYKDIEMVVVDDGSNDDTIQKFWQDYTEALFTIDDIQALDWEIIN